MISLGTISHLCFALLGGMLIYKGLKPSSLHRSLPMMWRNEAAVPISLGVRVILVFLGASLAVLSVLLALKIVR
jgi:hypothetical protein